MINASHVAIAVLLGGTLGAGLWCLVAAAPTWRAPALIHRVAPYIRDVTDPAGTSLPTAMSDPTLALAGGITGSWRAAQRWFARAVGTSASVERRLAQASRGGDVAAFRGEQLAWAAMGAAAAAGVAGVLALTGRFSFPAALLPLAGAVVGAAARDFVLSSQAKARVARIEEELPTVLEFLSLCLSAGEGVFGSVRRVAAVGSGELTGELRVVVTEVDTGATLTDSLTAMTRRLHVPVLTRAIDHTVAAIDRGSPLAQTLQDQATDARDEGKRALIESAGKKEILMMIPLVFGLLPLSVLFAIFPGIVMLQAGF
ncbi:type II secretion system F family protein [Microbacterium amylolyticum]|uniref:Tight adherence protein C n=1 Tax=Microbacterium amylolyticum TaxID=936337 RepID=A0ABS4ZKJ2_9MICO|nr:type II secretion system F family protein [Microbacterium amylolyticum]MBP2437810.1 tight adherence protein C [Microbacterium amylolyticum]